jgi:hypothetical protein
VKRDAARASARITSLGDDNRSASDLNECMGAFTGYEAPFLAWSSLAGAKVRLADLSVEALARDWELELEALRRRAKLQHVAGSSSGQKRLSAA